jgi:hypothetical protein
MFGLEMSGMERFLSTINFALTNIQDLRNVLEERGFGGAGVDFPGLHAEG